MSDQPLDLLQIRNETFVREISFHDELASTNTKAMELSSSDYDTPLLVIAERQTSGRGRGSNAWWSSGGALTFTLLVDLPMLRIEQIGPMSLTVGLAICQLLEEFAPAADLALKWPNDVYLEGKKVCGILIERPVATEPRLAIGIGINVNNSMADAPDALQQKAVSLCDALETEVDRNRLLIGALTHLEKRIDDHIHRRADLLDQWRAYCLLTGREVSIDMHGEIVTGTCKGVDDDGALIVQSGFDTHRCIAGEVVRF